ncbi:TPA: class D beta-lactamase [Salmonella enterica]|nr:class D beta-lactamase [Salmonella enterica]
MNVLKPIFLLLLSISLTACQTQLVQQKKTIVLSQQQQANNVAINNFFEEVKTNGVIIIYDGKHYQVYGNNISRSNTYYVPASTFKMLNAVIGIEHGLTSPNEVFRWQREKLLFPSWEKDMTLTEAMSASSIPIYQKLAKRIGLNRMQNEVKRIGFGNSNIGNQVDNFWLVGPLKITPQQEAEFAYKLANKKLPLSVEAQEQVNTMLFNEEVNGNKVFAKSGWGWDVEPQVGWFTGWVVKPTGQVVAFSLNMEMRKDIASKRKEIAYASLKQLGII